ncbi:MAG: 4-hydroxy-3-methylbut-2-enyl diphosphate reductase [Candidatus Omnitrophota bacterium]
MKVTIAKSAGFCFGVKRALEIAFKTAQSKEPVFMLGDIVHNEDVVDKIKKAGIKKINKLDSGKNKILLIRAHGTSKTIIEKAKKKGYKIADATCPMVKEIHRIAQRMEKEGYKIIIMGDKYHDEVVGIMGQLNSKAIVIDSLKSLPINKIKKIKKGAVVVQSTQNLEKVNKIVDFLKKYIKELKFFDTICRPTREKQEEIKILPQFNDVMIIIGSKTSANTKRLYEISMGLNKNTHWVESQKGLKENWFRQATTVGITAGASTPDSTTKSIVACIKNFS